MAVTHFQIFSLPNETYIESFIDTDPLVTETLYPIADENLLNFNRIPSLEGFAVSDSFTYKTYDSVNDIWSNLATGYIKWKTDDDELEPASSDAIEVLVNEDSIRLIDLLPINEATEFIIVTNITGVNSFYLEGPISIGQKLTIIDLYETKVDIKEFGGGYPYSILSYVVGKDVSDPVLTNYTLTVNVDSIAELHLYGVEEVVNYTGTFDVLGVPTDYNIKQQRNVLEVIKGYAFGTAKIQIDINSDFLDNNEWNSVIVQINGVETEYFLDEIFEVEIPLDINGRGTLKVTSNIIEDAIEDNDGLVTITLLEINDDAGLVSLTDFEVEIITDF